MAAGRLRPNCQAAPSGPQSVQRQARLSLAVWDWCGTSLQGLCKPENAEAHCKMLDRIGSHEEDDERPWGKQLRVAKCNPATKCRRDQNCDLYDPKNRIETYRLLSTGTVQRGFDELDITE